MSLLHRFPHRLANVLAALALSIVAACATGTRSLPGAPAPAAIVPDAAALGQKLYANVQAYAALGDVTSDQFRSWMAAEILTATVFPAMRRSLVSASCGYFPKTPWMNSLKESFT